MKCFLVVLLVSVLSGCTLTWSPGNSVKPGYPGLYHIEEQRAQDDQERLDLIEALRQQDLQEDE